MMMDEEGIPGMKVEMGFQQVPLSQNAIRMINRIKKLVWMNMDDNVLT